MRSTRASTSVIKSLTNLSLGTETYNKLKPWHSSPTHSRNLAAFSVISTSPWMKKFLSSPFFAWKSKDRIYGQPNELFDALQVVLSHLVLNPLSPFALQIPTSRGDYDIAKVYLWNLPLETIYRRAPDSKQRAGRSPTLSVTLVPKLQSRSPAPEPEMHLDLHSLVHIRNFWRRHFTAKEDATYHNMTETLTKSRRAPRKWDRALQEPLRLEKNWVGHYSCLHPWPKKLDKFEEKQSCAEDWHDHGIDPLVRQGCPLLSSFVFLSQCPLPPRWSLFIDHLSLREIHLLIQSAFSSRPSTSQRPPTTLPGHKQATGLQSSARSPPLPPPLRNTPAHHTPIFAASPHTSISPPLPRQSQTNPATRRTKNTTPSSASGSAA